jgi:uracil DNA glycosylase
MTGAVIAQFLKWLGYQLEDRRNEAQFWKGKVTLLLQHVLIGSEAQTASHSMGSWDSFLGALS